MTMQKYVGVKLIDAEPMTRREWDTTRGLPIDEQSAGKDDAGYKVRYPDGYVSWSTKEAFEKAYFPLQMLDGRTITQDDVDRFTGPSTVRKIDERTALVSVETKTGFVQHEPSSCVDPGCYDERIGREVGEEAIKKRIWGHLGFVLRWARNGLRTSCVSQSSIEDRQS